MTDLVKVWREAGMSDDEIARMLTIPRSKLERGTLIVTAHPRGGFEVYWSDSPRPRTWKTRLLEWLAR